MANGEQQPYNLDALGLDSETTKSLRDSLNTGVDQAQRKYFEQINKDSLFKPINNQTTPTAVPITGNQPMNEPGVNITAPGKQQALNDLLTNLYGTPEMRGYKK